jgi:hypothetical protein
MGRGTLFVDPGFYGRAARPRIADPRMRRPASRDRLGPYLWEAHQCTLFMC